MVQVEYLGETKIFSPQEVSAMVLMKVCSPTIETAAAKFDANTLAFR